MSTLRSIEETIDMHCELATLDGGIRPDPTMFLLKLFCYFLLPNMYNILRRDLAGDTNSMRVLVQTDLDLER